MQKKEYIAPEVEIIQLDNEISLALSSTPATYPGENEELISSSNYGDPFKDTYLV